MDFFSNSPKIELKTNILNSDTLNDNSTLLILATNNKQKQKLSHSLIPPLQIPSSNLIITTYESGSFKEKVKKLAQCRKQTPQKIHNDLKRKYNYHSYQTLDREKYYFIINIIEKELQDNCSLKQN